MRYAVVLAGGSGTRLWPMSRRGTPKQLLRLGASDDESLLSATCTRLADIDGGVMVVATEDQLDDLLGHLPDVSRVRPLAEPEGRNTAAAMGLAALYLLAHDPDAVMGIFPSDHTIADEDRFAEVRDQAYSIAERSDCFTVIGIPPTRPETGFGYLRVGEASGTGGLAVERFVEKPALAQATQMLATGDHLWNSGMTFTRARHLIDEIRAHLPATWSGLERIAAALDEGGPARARAVASEVYPTLPRISLEHGVLQHTTGVQAVRGEFGWDDVGSWSALAGFRAVDGADNVVTGEAVLRDARRNVVVAEQGHVIALIGVEDLVVVQAGDAVLVVPMDRAQEVREVVSALEERQLERFL